MLTVQLSSCCHLCFLVFSQAAPMMRISPVCPNSATILLTFVKDWKVFSAGHNLSAECTLKSYRAYAGGDDADRLLHHLARTALRRRLAVVKCIHIMKRNLLITSWLHDLTGLWKALPWYINTFNDDVTNECIHMWIYFLYNNMHCRDENPNYIFINRIILMC